MGQQGHLPPLCGHCARWDLRYKSTLLSTSFDYVCLFLTGFLRLCLYVSYMAFMLWILYVPLHILRRIYITTKYTRYHTWPHQHVKIIVCCSLLCITDLFSILIMFICKPYSIPAVLFFLCFFFLSSSTGTFRRVSTMSFRLTKLSGT